MCGQRLSSAKTRPWSWIRRIGRWTPCTTSRPFASSSSRLAANVNSWIGASMSTPPAFDSLGLLLDHYRHLFVQTLKTSPGHLSDRPNALLPLDPNDATQVGLRPKHHTRVTRYTRCSRRGGNRCLVGGKVGLPHLTELQPPHNGHGF